MKKLYEIYIESKNKESYLVSDARLDFFRSKYSDVQIVGEIENYTFVRHKGYYNDMPPAGCDAIIVGSNNKEYICRDYHTTWTTEMGKIWDVRTEKYYEMLDKLEEYEKNCVCKYWSFEWYCNHASCSGIGIKKLGDERMRRIMDFFEDFDRNVQQIENDFARSN